MLNVLKGKKTYITAVVAIVTAWGAYLTGQDANIMDAVRLTFTAALAAFVRSGVANS